MENHVFILRQEPKIVVKRNFTWKPARLLPNSSWISWYFGWLGESRRHRASKISITMGIFLSFISKYVHSFHFIITILIGDMKILRKFSEICMSFFISAVFICLSAVFIKLSALFNVLSAKKLIYQQLHQKSRLELVSNQHFTLSSKHSPSLFF